MGCGILFLQVECLSRRRPGPWSLPCHLTCTILSGGPQRPAFPHPQVLCMLTTISLASFMLMPPHLPPQCFPSSKHSINVFKNFVLNLHCPPINPCFECYFGSCSVFKSRSQWFLTLWGSNDLFKKSPKTVRKCRYFHCDL